MRTLTHTHTHTSCQRSADTCSTKEKQIRKIMCKQHARRKREKRTNDIEYIVCKLCPHTVCLPGLRSLEFCVFYFNWINLKIDACLWHSGAMSVSVCLRMPCVCVCAMCIARVSAADQHNREYGLYANSLLSIRLVLVGHTVCPGVQAVRARVDRALLSDRLVGRLSEIQNRKLLNFNVKWSAARSSMPAAAIAGNANATMSSTRRHKRHNLD